MPAIRASSEVHRPAARTTVSASTVPLSVSTAVTAPPSRRNPVTVTPNANTAPRSCAPFASESAASPGFTVASVGVTVPPTRSSTWAIGHHSCTCAGSSTRHSTSNSRCMSAPVSSSCIRPGVRATVSDPTRRKPVSTPVSAGSAAYVCALMPGELGQRMRAADLGDQPGGVPGRPRGEPHPLEHEHVGHAELRQVVGDRRADDPAADDHDLRPRGWLRDRFEDRAVDVAVRQVFRDGHGPEG